MILNPDNHFHCVLELQIACMFVFLFARHAKLLLSFFFRDSFCTFCSVLWPHFVCTMTVQTFFFNLLIEYMVLQTTIRVLLHTTNLIFFSSKIQPPALFSFWCVFACFGKTCSGTVSLRIRSFCKHAFVCTLMAIPSDLGNIESLIISYQQ